MKKISVVGAGFAGLTVSLRLAQKGFSVDLYESSSRVGGLLGTDKTTYGIAERAANALIRTEKAQGLFDELGLTPSLPLEESKKRFLFRDKPRRWPLTLSESFSFIRKMVPQLIKGKESFAPKEGESLEDWGLQHLGSAPTRFILEPAMQGIYANAISGLSASLILGAIFKKKKKDKYRGLLTGPGGMQDLVNHLEAECRKLGVRIHLNTLVRAEYLTGPVVVATSARAAASFLEVRAPLRAQLLAGITMSSLMSVTAFFKDPQLKYRGFGCLIPRGQNIRALGILMNSYIFKDRDKTYNETWILGGLSDEDLLDLEDVQVLELIQKERQRILGEAGHIIDFRINRWKKALPYYDLKLESTLAELEKLPPEKGLYLHGNYLGGIGLSKILERSDLLAEQIASHYV